MTYANKLLTASVLGLMVAAPLFTALPAFAETGDSTATTTVEPTPQAPQSAMMLQISQLTLDALKGTHDARAALFDGNTDSAKTLLTAALDAMTKAVAEDGKLALPTAKATTEDSFLPFDVSMGLSEGFVMTPEAQAPLATAAQHMKAGESDQALETLRLANIDVTVKAALVPGNATLGHLTQAQTFMTGGDYWNAGLQLKAVEDGVIVDGYAIDSLPVQG